MKTQGQKNVRELPIINSGFFVLPVRAFSVMGDLKSREMFSPVLPGGSLWCAYCDISRDDEKYGYGATEQEAIDSLRRQYAD